VPGPAAALLVAAGLTTPPDFQELRQDESCRYLVSETPESWPTLRAECLWPQVAPSALTRLLGDWASYARHFSTIASSEVVGPMGAATAVHHVHTAPLMADREALLLFWQEPAGTGQAFRWTLAPGQPPAARGRVALARDTGHWTVAPNPDGPGSLVVSELAYDPGGRVPDALVHWFQQVGVAAFVDELAEAVSAQP